MKNDRLLATLAAVLGLVLVAVGVSYIALNEHDIPSFFPGHVSHASSHHHVKHGIAAIFLGLACLAFAWFRTGPRELATAPPASALVAAADQLITYFQAVVIGLLQGVTELFPISSLGHAVILPKLLRLGSEPGQAVLSRLPRRHAPRDRDRALRLLLPGMGPDPARASAGASATARSATTIPTRGSPGCSSSGTIPAGLIGLLFEHKLRSLFANPTAAAAFLTVNGLILFAAEYLRRRAPGAEERARELERAPESRTSAGSEKRLATLGYREAVGVGTAQAAALFPGISRAGVTIGGGLFVGLTHEDAARYAFLLATPIIGAAALLKLPELVGHNGDGVRGQALVGALCAGAAAWFCDQVPDALLRDEHPDAVRRVLPLRWCRCIARVRVLECPSTALSTSCKIGCGNVEKGKLRKLRPRSFSTPCIACAEALDCLLRRAQSASRSKPSPKAVAGRRKSAETVDESETGPANFFGPV